MKRKGPSVDDVKGAMHRVADQIRQTEQQAGLKDRGHEKALAVVRENFERAERKKERK